MEGAGADAVNRTVAALLALAGVENPGAANPLAADPAAAEPAAADLPVVDPPAADAPAVDPPAADAPAADPLSAVLAAGVPVAAAAAAAVPAGADPAADLLRALSHDDVARIESAMFDGPSYEVLWKGDDQLSCRRRSLQTLAPGTWLDDDIIHSYLHLLSVRDAQLCSDDSTRKRSHFFKSFFTTLLLSIGHNSEPGEYCYKNVRRWSEKVPGECRSLFFSVLFCNRSRSARKR